MEISDLQLIKNIKRENCNDCIGELRSRHCGLIINLYSKYHSILQKLHFNREEFNDEINYLIYTSAKKYDLRRAKKIKFSTYLGENTRYFCLNKINELKKKSFVEAEPDEITRLMDDCVKHSHLDKINQNEICDYIYSLLEQIKDPRVKKIFELRFFTSSKKKMTWKEIGKDLDLTSQSVLNIFNKNIKFIKAKLLSKIEQDRI